MAGYDNKPGSGALFKNDKGDNPNRPDYRGDATLQDGTKVKLSAWLKGGAKGKFLSLKIEPEQGGQPRQRDDFRSSGSDRMAGGGSNQGVHKFPDEPDVPW